MIKKTTFFLFLCLFTNTFSISHASPNDITQSTFSFEFKLLSDLPSTSSFEDAFIGLSNDALIMAGGTDHLKNNNGCIKDVFQDEVFVLEMSESEDSPILYKDFKLPFKIANGAVVETESGIICIGGRNKKEIFSSVLSLVWDKKNKQIQCDSLPDLPIACYYPAASILNGKIYVTCGKTAAGTLKHFWAFDLSAYKNGQNVKWQEIQTWPGQARFGHTLINQNNGVKHNLYLIGGKNDTGIMHDIYCFDPSVENKKTQWKKLSDTPIDIFKAKTAVLGQNHIVIGSSFFCMYHTVSDTWNFLCLPTENFLIYNLIGHGNKILLFGCDRIKNAQSKIILANPNYTSNKQFKFVDYTILVFYLIAMVLIGLSCSKKEKTSDDFFLGGKRIPWWAAGLSIMATQVSAIGFMAVTAKSYTSNWSYLTGVLTWFVVVPIVTWAFIPFFKKLNITTAYEFLEARFGIIPRLYAAALYCLFQVIGRMGIVLYLPALALSSVTGMNIYLCIITMGVLSTLYTVMGGMEAVVWTDVVQAIVLLGGAIVCVVLVISDVGLGNFFHMALKDGKFNLGRLDWDVTSPVIWVILIGNFFTRLIELTSDQAIVQRYLTTKDEKKAKKALWLNALTSIPWAFAIFVLGTAIYCFYKSNPHLQNPLVDSDGIVPFFIIQKIPMGVSGLIIAGIFAASMSSLDSSMHSVSTVITTDFYGRFSKKNIDRKKLHLARYIIIFLGVFGTTAACWMSSLSITSMCDIFLEFTGLFTGSIAGLFMLGVLTKKANQTGAMLGAGISGFILYMIKKYTVIHFFLYGGISLLSCFILGYFLSIIFPGKRHIEGLTLFSISEKS